MNKNMSAIGFKSIEKKKKNISDILKNIGQSPDKTFSYEKRDGNTAIEQYGYIGDSYGLVLYSLKNKNDVTKLRRWNIFAFSDNTTRVNNVTFKKHTNGDLFAFCEDEETGTEIEFRVNNIIDFESHKGDAKTFAMNSAEVNLVGLGVIGNIIFPVKKNDESLKVRAKEHELRRNLIKQLRNGDESAEQKLFDQSLEIAYAVRERLKSEDVLSVFEGYYLPYGEEDGTYALLGDITEIEESINGITNEIVYNLTLDVTGVKTKLLINKENVVGMPMIGMRFMGICFLQGNVLFK